MYTRGAIDYFSDVDTSLVSQAAKTTATEQAVSYLMSILYQYGGIYSLYVGTETGSNAEPI